MIMLVLSLLASILSLSLGQKCCVPAQWEGMEGTVLAVSQDNTDDPTIVTGSIGMSYDAINRRVAAMMYMSTGGFTTSVGVILNYAQGIQYTVSGNNCTRTPLPPFKANCIPSDAVLSKSGYYGPPNNKLMVNSYDYKRGQLDVSVTVTANSCVPVGEVVTGQTDAEFVVQSIGFSNITAGINNMNAFNIPASCVNSPMVQVNMNPMVAKVLRRYLHLY